MYKTYGYVRDELGHKSARQWTNMIDINWCNYECYYMSVQWWY